MVDNATQTDLAWLVGKIRIGVTAGASAPEVLVQSVINRLKEYGAKSVRTLEGVEEHVAFPLPKGLSKFQTAGDSSQINAPDLHSVLSNNMQDVRESKFITIRLVWSHINLE